jgi:CP family cyanate transporter-like MFS transporter
VTRRATLLFWTGLVLVSLNLRPAAVSVGPVLAEVQDGLGLSDTQAALLTSLPVLGFAVFGALAPLAAARVGLHRTTLLAMVAVTVGLSTRVLTGSGEVFLLLSLLALSGTAVANVLLPSLVKRHQPDRIGPATAVYSTVLAVGLTAPLVLTVPLAELLGGSVEDGWREGLGAWAVLGLLALVPWVLMSRHDGTEEVSGPRIPYLAVARTRLGIALAVYFGLQSLQAYAIFGWFAQLWRDAGFSATEAGLLVGLLTGTTIPLSYVLPRVLVKAERPALVLLAVLACYPVAYVGLMVAPASLAVLWAVLTGAGTTTFPLILTLIGLRARTPEGTATLSAFVQSAGYLLAVTGPFLVGLLYSATDGWTVPLAFLLVLVVPLAWLSVGLARPAYIEDHLPDAATRA